MNLVMDIKKFNSSYIYFCEPIRNNIMNDGNFLRLLYTTPLFTLSGIVFDLPIDDTDFIMENSSGHNNNYSYCSISKPFLSESLEKLKEIEESILETSQTFFPLKTPQYKVYSTLKNPSQPIKVFHEKSYASGSNNSFVLLLKISGVWETADMYGLTFKFISAKQY